MIAIPIAQASAGVGNTIVKNVLMHNMKSLHLVYLDANGTIYSGNNQAVLKIYASDEQVIEASELIAPVLLATIILDKNIPAELYDVIGSYNHLKINIDSIVDGKITTYYATREG